MAHEHDVQDSDKRFVIDPATRTIKNESGKIVLIQGDHNSERFTFETPRYVDGHDMTKCNTVKIHYLNATEPGVYEAGDLRVDPDNSELVIFTWLISGNATMQNGPLNFAVKFACVNNGVTEYAWGTGVYSGLTVGMSIDNSDIIVQEYADILEQWKSEILADLDTRIETAVDARVGTTIDAANEAAISAQTQAALAAEAAISAKACTNVLKGEQSGEVVRIDDAFPADILETTVYGQSEQTTTTGKNLLPYPYTDTTIARNGITFTDNGDGSLTLNGTATNNALFMFAGDNGYDKGIAVTSGSYFLSGCPSGGSSETYYLRANVWSDASTFVGSDDFGAGSSVKISDGDTVYVCFVVRGGITVNNLVVKPQLELGETATEWEPYSGGVASPSPDWPQDISSIAEVDLVTTGKNLFDPSHLIDGTGWTLVDGVYSGYASYQHDKYGVEGYPFSYTFEENTQYTLSFNGRSDNTNSNSGLVIRVRYTDGTISPYFKVTASDTMVKHVFTTAVDKTVAKICITYDYSKKSYLSDIQLEMGAEATEYVEYKGSSTTIDLAGNKLRSLPDGTQDELVVDAAGNYGIVKRTERILIDGSQSVVEAQTLSMYKEEDERKRYHILLDKRPYCDTSLTNITSTIRGVTPIDTWENREGVSTATAGLYVYIESLALGTADDFTAYITEKPFEVCYELLESDYVPIGTLDTLLALPENTSNVWAVTNLGATVKVKYVQDINIVINNLIGGIQNG